jgi:hypothetical protein
MSVHRETARHPNSPSRPSKALPETRLQFSGLKILELDGLGHSMTRLVTKLQALIGPHTEVDIQFNEANTHRFGQYKFISAEDLFRILCPGILIPEPRYTISDPSQDYGYLYRALVPEISARDGPVPIYSFPRRDDDVGPRKTVVLTDGWEPR